MERRTMLTSMTAALAIPALADAQDVKGWVAWWTRSKAYTLAIADAMPAGDYAFSPFGSGSAEGVRSGDGARTFGQVMQHIAQAEGFILHGLARAHRPRRRRATLANRRR